MLRDYLSQHGLVVELRGAALSTLAGLIPVADSLPTLWVSGKDAPRAKELVAAYESAGLGDEPPWVCRGCGEEVDAHFQRCWNCERPQII